MSGEEHGPEFWDACWNGMAGGEHGHPHGHGPDELLLSEVKDLAPGASLDVGCGNGANVVWLAAQSWQATGVDFSAAAISQAQAAAQEKEVSVELVVADATTWTPPRQYDLITFFYLHLTAEKRTATLRMAREALAPGGTLLFIGHDRSGDHTHHHHHDDGESHSHPHGHDDPDHQHAHDAPDHYAHGHDHGPKPEFDHTQIDPAILTIPEEVVAELAGLEIERAEVLEHGEDFAGHAPAGARSTLVRARKPPA